MPDQPQEKLSRRSVIHMVTGLVGCGGIGVAGYILVKSSGPTGHIREQFTFDIDLGDIPLGGEVRVLVDGNPYFIRHRTPEEIRLAEAVDWRKLHFPERDADRLRPRPDGTLNKAILIVSGKCTYRGCVPLGPSNATGDYGGWYCPCCGAHYDTSGRVRRGPGNRNLPVPEYKYLSATRIRIIVPQLTPI